MAMKGFLMLIFCGMPLISAQFKEKCTYPVDVVLTVDTSDTQIDRDDILGATKRGLQLLIDIYDIGTRPDQSRLAICLYGDTYELLVGFNDDARQNPTTLKNLIGDGRGNYGFFPIGGFAAIHQGARCAIEAARSSRRDRTKLMALVVVANDLQTESLSFGNITLAQQNLYVSVITVGDRFVDKAEVFRYASSPSAVTELRSFDLFEEDANRFFPDSYNSMCPIDLTTTTSTTTTTTTTTTTPRPQRTVRPCDNCIIINGVGYAQAEDCFHYYQCILQEDNTWMELRRPVAVGSYWDQSKITGNDPVLAACPFDPCIGRSDGTILGGYDNCRARITCNGGISTFVECCPQGTGLINGQCVFDPTCNDVCNPVQTTVGDCYLSPDVNGDPARFMANDGAMSMSMPCPVGTVYNNDMCGCAHDQSPFAARECRDHPEVRLEFGPDGTVRDISRNVYTTTTFGISTFEVTPGVYAARLNGSSGIRVANANSFKETELTLRVVYSSLGNVQNAAVVSDAECANTLRTVSIIDDGNVARGFARTVPNQDVTVNSELSSGKKEVILQYNGQELIMDSNGRMSSAAAGVFLAPSGFCNGINLGFTNDLPSFQGDIFEFELFKCVSDGPQDFERTP